MNLLSELILNPDLLAHTVGQRYLKIDVSGKVISASNVEETDPTVPSFVKAITSGQINQWDQAYSWGNHALIGYGLSTGDITAVTLTTALLTLTRSSGNLTAAIPTWNQSTTGSAATLTTSRTLTIGTTGKTFNGSANVSWSLAEIGAQPAGSYALASHTHIWTDITNRPTKISLAELNTGTSTVERVVDSKNLNDWISGIISAQNSGNGYSEQTFTYVASNIFTLAIGTPVAINVFLNGQRLVLGSDYTVSTNQVTVTTELNSGNEITITYFYSISGIGISGLGTTGFLPKWSSSSGLTNSIIQESGANILISGNAVWHAGNFNPASYQVAGSYAPLVHSHSWANITSGKPTTLAGYGITDAQANITAGTTLQYYRGDKTFQTLNTSAVPESGNLYYTDARVRAVILTGYTVGTNTAVAATDSILVSIGKIQSQLNNKQASGSYAAASHTHSASQITSGTFGAGNYVFPGILSVVGQSYQAGIINKGNSGTGTVTFNWNDGNLQVVTLTGNCTFAFSNPQVTSYQIAITQDATGGRTITWPTIHWADKTIPTLTGTPNSVDVLTLTYDGSKYLGVMSLNHGTP